jgi:hypothetical protein
MDNAILLSDLDAQGWDILNCTLLEAENVIDTTDSRMSDKRAVPPASVTDQSVAKGAGIKQSKIALNGAIPVQWLGQSAGMAAQGDLVERSLNKNAPNGYAGIDSVSGKMPSGSVPVSGTGTLTSVAFAFPPEFFVDQSVPGSPAVHWTAVPPESWLGVNPANAAAGMIYPRFNRVPFDASMVPALDSSKIASGVLDLERLPTSAVLSAPGDGTDGHTSDYYARDGTYKSMSEPVSYQPTLPGLAITVLGYAGSTAKVNVTSSRPGVILFGNIDPSTPDLLIEIVTQPINVPAFYFLKVYSARIGWNNSPVVTYQIPENPMPPTP